MNYALLHPPTWSPRELLELLPDPRIEVREIGQAKELTEEDRPTVFVLDAGGRTVVVTLVAGRPAFGEYVPSDDADGDGAVNPDDAFPEDKGSTTATAWNMPR